MSELQDRKSQLAFLFLSVAEAKFHSFFSIQNQFIRAIQCLCVSNRPNSTNNLSFYKNSITQILVRFDGKTIGFRLISNQKINKFKKLFFPFNKITTGFSLSV